MSASSSRTRSRFASLLLLFWAAVAGTALWLPLPHQPASPPLQRSFADAASATSTKAVVPASDQPTLALVYKRIDLFEVDDQVWVENSTDEIDLTLGDVDPATWCKLTLAALRQADTAKYAGKQIHEIQPVKFGGVPPIQPIRLH